MHPGEIQGVRSWNNATAGWNHVSDDDIGNLLLRKFRDEPVTVLDFAEYILTRLAEHRNNTDCSNLAQKIVGSFRINKNPQMQALCDAFESNTQVNEQVSYEEQEYALFSRIDQLVENNRTIVVYGTGDYCVKLLKNTKLLSGNIVAFIDQKANEGDVAFSKNVYQPAWLEQAGDVVVVVATAVSYAEINRKIKLYGIPETSIVSYPCTLPAIGAYLK